jgi:hypothetical protein
MIQKHIMAPKRKTATTANQHEAEKKVGRKVRRVVIDSDSEDEEEQKTVRKPKELHVQNGTAALVNGEAKADIVDGDDDEVVAEVTFLKINPIIKNTSISPSSTFSCSHLVQMTTPAVAASIDCNSRNSTKPG